VSEDKSEAIDSELADAGDSQTSNLEHTSQESSLAHQQNLTEPPSNPLLNPTPSAPTLGSQTFRFDIRRKHVDAVSSKLNV
jgi:hypothetical protein